MQRLCFALSILCLATFAVAADAPKPNIVLIVADDLGYADLSCQGQSKDVKTPNIDAIGAAGTRFTNGYVSGPVCSPTRAGLLTGRYQQRFGHHHNMGPGGPNGGQQYGLPLDQILLPQVLKQQGYVTGIFGKWHLGYEKPYHPTSRGFDEWFGPLSGSHSYVKEDGKILRNGEPAKHPGYLTDVFTEEAVSFIDRHHDKPFFLYLPYTATHTPMDEPPAKYREGVDPTASPQRQTFLAMLNALDAGVGQVMSALKKHGLDNEKTMVIFFSDNGGATPTNTSLNTPFRGMKGSVFEGGVRTASMIRWDKHIPAGKVEETPMIQLDYFATAAVAAGAKDAASKLKLDGVDLVPFLNGQAEKPHDKFYWKMYSQWAIRSGDLKLLFDTDGKTMLFDLSKDAGEQNDLYASRPEDAKRLKAEWDEWEKGNVAPLWVSSRPGNNAKGGGD